MPETTLEDCPLCGTLATFDTSDDGRRKHFMCVVCMEFIITIDAEQRLAQSTATVREKLGRATQAAGEKGVFLIAVKATRQGPRLHGAMTKWSA
jgi:hypothetical protein